MQNRSQNGMDLQYTGFVSCRWLLFRSNVGTVRVHVGRVLGDALPYAFGLRTPMSGIAFAYGENPDECRMDIISPSIPFLPFQRHSTEQSGPVILTNRRVCCGDTCQT